jgi:hypothetical protein
VKHQPAHNTDTAWTALMQAQRHTERRRDWGASLQSSHTHGFQSTDVTHTHKTIRPCFEARCISRRLFLGNKTLCLCIIRLMSKLKVRRSNDGLTKHTVHSLVTNNDDDDDNNHLALQLYASLGLLFYSPPLVSLLSFPSPSFNPHLS